MNATRLLSMIFFPWHVHGEIFLADRRQEWKQVFMIAASIAIESCIIVMVLEYWWFGQIFIKTTLFLMVTFFLLVIVPTGVISRRFKCILAWHAIILAFPAFISVIAIILLRFGINYLIQQSINFQIPGLLILALICVSWMLFWKFASHYLLYKGVKQTIPNMLRIVDVLGIISWILLVIFIKYVMRTFYVI